MVVEKRHAINEHYVPDRNGQSGAQSENGEFYLLKYIVSDRTIKIGGFKQRRKVKTFSKEKTDGGRLGISRAMNCPAKSSTAFVAVKPTRRQKKK